MLTLEMLPADQGDCLWIEYTDAGQTRRILIDGGTPSTYSRLKNRIEALPPEQRRFELFVVTHIDSDHIGGAVKLIDDPPEGLTFGDVWFNGFRHLPKPQDELGAKQGEELTRMLVEGNIPWNKTFGGQRIAVGDDGDLPRAELDGGLTLTAVSPGIEQLKKLYPKWEKEMAKLRAEQSEDESRPKPEDELGDKLDVVALANSQFKEDKAEPNGSSIALLLEFKNRRLLLGADAHPTVIANNIDRVLRSSGRPALELDAYKVAHHGMRGSARPRKRSDRHCTGLLPRVAERLGALTALVLQRLWRRPRMLASATRVRQWRVPRQRAPDNVGRRLRRSIRLRAVLVVWAIAPSRSRLHRALGPK